VRSEPGSASISLFIRQMCGTCHARRQQLSGAVVTECPSVLQGRCRLNHWGAAELIKIGFFRKEVPGVSAI
jgi:hypothetical protein